MIQDCTYLRDRINMVPTFTSARSLPNPKNHMEEVFRQTEGPYSYRDGNLAGPLQAIILLYTQPVISTQVKDTCNLMETLAADVFNIGLKTLLIMLVDMTKHLTKSGWEDIKILNKNSTVMTRVEIGTSEMQFLQMVICRLLNLFQTLCCS